MLTSSRCETGNWSWSWRTPIRILKESLLSSHHECSNLCDPSATTMELQQNIGPPIDTNQAPTTNDANTNQPPTDNIDGEGIAADAQDYGQPAQPIAFEQVKESEEEEQRHHNHKHAVYTWSCRDDPTTRNCHVPYEHIGQAQQLKRSKALRCITICFKKKFIGSPGWFPPYHRPANLPKSPLDWCTPFLQALQMLVEKSDGDLAMTLECLREIACDRWHKEDAPLCSKDILTAVEKCLIKQHEIAHGAERQWGRARAREQREWEAEGEDEQRRRKTPGTDGDPSQFQHAPQDDMDIKGQQGAASAILQREIRQPVSRLRQHTPSEPQAPPQPSQQQLYHAQCAGFQTAAENLFSPFSGSSRPPGVHSINYVQRFHDNGNLASAEAQVVFQPTMGDQMMQDAPAQGSGNAFQQQQGGQGASVAGATFSGARVFEVEDGEEEDMAVDG